MKPILLLLCASALGAAAQTNSPGNDGYLSRSRQMYDTGNYVGCIDQLRSLDRSILSATEREQADWLLALAAYATSGPGAAAPPARVRGQLSRVAAPPAGHGTHRRLPARQ